MMVADDIPDITLLELAGFTFDLTDAGDCELLNVAIAALDEADADFHIEVVL